MHSTRPLVQLVRLVRIENHSIGEMHIIMRCSYVSLHASGCKGVNTTRPLV